MYMEQIECPKCGSISVKPLKSWNMKPNSKPKAPLMKISMMLCQQCGHKFRHAEKVES